MYIVTGLGKVVEAVVDTLGEANAIKRGYERVSMNIAYSVYKQVADNTWVNLDQNVYPQYKRVKLVTEGVEGLKAEFI